MSIFKHFTPKNTRFAIYAGNPGFSGMVICSDFIGYSRRFSAFYIDLSHGMWTSDSRRKG